VDYEIVVGVCTKNCENTIESIIKTVDKALSKYFPKNNSLIICCDGSSKDSTKKNFNAIKTKCDKKWIVEKGKKSKGSAVKTIMQKVKPLGFQTLLILDGDLENLKELWIKRLVNPVLNKGYEATIASYKTHKYDTLIGKTLVYPLMKSLFNIDLKTPMTGEYCLSRKLCLELLGSKYFPNDHSVDLFIVLTTICEKYKTCEIKLGTRNHCSSGEYCNPESVLIPRFTQIMKEFIDLARYYKSSISKNEKYSISKKCSYDKGRVKNIEICIPAYQEFSRDYIKNDLEYVMEVYKHLSKQSMTGLKIAWLNWLCIYFDKTSKMSNDDVDKLLKDLTKLFTDNKELLNL